MHDTLRFRRELATRLLGLLGAASIAACDSGGAKGASSTATSATTTQSAATTTNIAGDAGMGGGGGAGGVGGGGGGMGGSVANPPVLSCFSLPIDAGADVVFDAGAAAGSCPTDPKTVLNDFLALGCPNGWEPYKVVSGPMIDAQGECCYMTNPHLCGPGGRPFLAHGRALVAAAERGEGARGWVEGDAPCLEGLSVADRASLADAWTRDALCEHASVASFSRFSLALVTAGAPAELVELAHRAALDEVRHARLCFALASAYVGEDIAPGPFPLRGEVRVDGTLAALAASTVEEGCIGETVAALVAAEQLAGATDPAVRSALAHIAADEARHAELAWRTVAWAVQTGGAEVRAAVEQALLGVLAHREDGGVVEAVSQTVMAAHGRLDATTTAKVVASAMIEVVAPAARVLLQRSNPSGSLVPAPSCDRGIVYALT